MDSNEKLVTAILTQAVTDAKYTGIRKYYLKQKMLVQQKTYYCFRRNLVVN